MSEALVATKMYGCRLTGGLGGPWHPALYREIDFEGAGTVVEPPVRAGDAGRKLIAENGEGNRWRHVKHQDIVRWQLTQCGDPLAGFDDAAVQANLGGQRVGDRL